MSSSKATRYQAPALDKGLDVLEYLSTQSVPRSQVEIAQGIERGANEIYRMLVALEERGYLRRDTISGKYRLSLKLYHLSHRHSPLEQLSEAAGGPMRKLADELRQSCHLSIIYDDRLMVLSETRSPEPISLAVAEGTLFPMVGTVSGRVLLAFSDPKQQEVLLDHDPAYPAMTASEQKQLRARLTKIRRQRFDLALNGFTEGVTECAAIVGNTEAGLIASLCVAALSTGLRQRVDKDKLVEALLKTTAEIDRCMGL